MEQRTESDVSPYRVFSRSEWANLRQDTPMTLEPAEVRAALGARPARHIGGRGDLPAAVAPSLALRGGDATACFEPSRLPRHRRPPRCRTSSGSAARSRPANRPPRACCRRCSRAGLTCPKSISSPPTVFFYPNAVLERERLMEKKGFPESYDLPALLRFLSDIKAGRRPVRAPVYSHLIYDVIPNQWIEIDRPDILIVEGLNVLQAGRLPKDGKAIPFVSDFFDFSVYLDADEGVLLSWYVDRFLALRGTAFADPKSYFHRYAKLSDEEAIDTATSIWSRINSSISARIFYRRGHAPI